MKRTKDTDEFERAQLSRRGILGVTLAAATVGVGSVYGLSQMSQTAQANVGIDLDGTDVVLEGDERVTGITVSGPLEATYDSGSEEAAGARANVSVGTTDSDNDDGGSSGYTFEDLDPDAGEITQDVSVEFDVAEEFADPDAGETVEVELFADVMFQVDDADAQLIAEAITSETATITVERADEERGEGNQGNSGGSGGGGAGGTGSASVEVGATLSIGATVE